MPEDRDGIPTWQKQAQKHDQNQTTSPNESGSEPLPDMKSDNDGQQEMTEVEANTSASEAALPSADQKQLLQHAIQFLQDPQIQNALPEQKRAFLRSKGLSDQSIDENSHLLDTSASSSSESLEPRQVPQPSTEKNPEWSSSPRTTSTPPIITYPEQVLHPQKPPPLITRTRLLNTAYAFAGLAATFYGLSTYLVTPMLESLTAARHDFHEHTLTQLEDLNKRLASTVSADPAQANAKAGSDQSKELNGAIDTASDDSDPTELFHRDFGTQTNPEDFPQSSTSPNPEDPELSSDPVENNQRRLRKLSSKARDLVVDDVGAESQTVHETRTVTDILRDQLEGLAFPASADGGSYGLGASGAGFNNLYGTTSKKETDEISRVKQEIRGLKGSLLSARSFPTGSIGAAAMARRDMHSDAGPTGSSSE